AAARSAVRCNRLSGIQALLAPEHNMGGLFRRHELDAFVSQGPQVNGIEQPLASTEHDRRDCDVHLVDKAGTKILLDRVRPTADPHVQSAGGLACTVESLANASRDEVERRVAFHLDGWTRMMGQDEDWKVIRWIVPPPAFPAHVRPG